MINEKSVLAIVPARGGSKGLPGKNVRLVAGKPLLAWSVEAALQCPLIDTVVVSTDAPDIAAAGQAAGAEVPFVRPAELASDTASSVDVLLHCLDYYATIGRRFEIVALFEPTSPLREPTDATRALELLTTTRQAEAVVSVCRSEGGHPAFLYSLAETGHLSPFSPESGRHLRRQDLSPVYFPEGTMYVSYVEALRSRRSFYHANTFAFEVPRWKSIEVDEIHDLICVDALLRHRNNPTI